MQNVRAKVSQNGLGEQIKKEVENAIQGELGELMVREILSMALSEIALAERNTYLSQKEDDKGNGSYYRSLNIGSVPVKMTVPRTRLGQFRPSLLPPLYQRGYTEETQNLIMGLLSSCRSVNAAKSALKKMGVSVPDKEIDTVASEFIESIDLKNTSPIDPDMLAVFIDAKYIEVREEDRLRTACIYVAIGIDTKGMKRVLACQSYVGREHLDNWKKMLRTLIERGLRRVMTVVQDDFSGLLPITQGFFPQSDIQLCIVHMQRNAKTHFSKSDANEFVARMRTIKSAWNRELALTQFKDLCDDFEKKAPHFVAQLRKKKNHYLAFLDFPLRVRMSFSTTNIVEAINGQLEKMRRNNGGYFHNENVLKLKMGITIDALQNDKWRNVTASMQMVLPQLNAMFERKFESDIAS